MGEEVIEKNNRVYGVSLLDSIGFPNTAPDNDKAFYAVGNNCDEIIKISKNGEMAEIGWFMVIKNDYVLAEIKESVCDVYFKPEK